jgi:hypothetical protein
MFKTVRGDPDVVHRDRSSPGAKLTLDQGIGISGPSGRHSELHSWSEINPLEVRNPLVESVKILLIPRAVKISKYLGPIYAP